ncbi:MAG: YciI family protein [Dehalococcoidia bacterium]
MTNCGKVIESLQGRSAFRGTERLADSATAKTVRATGGRATVTDGPFAEARELIGGFILGQCPSREDAVALAALIPGAASGCVEVREVLGD